MFSQSLHPVQTIHRTASEPDYALERYFLDIEKKAGVEWQGKTVSILIDRNFFKQLPSSGGEEKELETDPFLGIAELKSVRDAAGSLHEALVGSRAELANELQKAAQSDIVILVAHGSPGDFILGSNAEKISQATLAEISPVPFTRPEPVLVFVSCDFGDKALGRGEHSREPWKALSDRLLSGTSGRSFASINPLSFHRTLKQGHSETIRRPSAWMVCLRLTCVQGTGLNWASVLLGATNRLTNHYGGARGVREYRAPEGLTLFYESDE